MSRSNEELAAWLCNYAKYNAPSTGNRGTMLVIARRLREMDAREPDGWVLPVGDGDIPSGFRGWDSTIYKQEFSGAAPVYIGTPPTEPNAEEAS